MAEAHASHTPPIHVTDSRTGINQDATSRPEIADEKPANPANTIPSQPYDVESYSPDGPSYAHTVNGGQIPPKPTVPPTPTTPNNPLPNNAEAGAGQPPMPIPAPYPTYYYYPPQPRPTAGGQPPQGATPLPGYPTPYPVSLPYDGYSYTPITPQPAVSAVQPVPQQATSSSQEKDSEFDFTYVEAPARIAIYDSLKTAPRVIQIDGGPTHEYIEHIASLTFKHAKEAGGAIPYTVIREVSENFIHAKFREVVVSIMDDGNTIRFADQGPGIPQKERAQEPGFSSASEPMKRYIRGVGSGLPIVRDYLDTTHGHIEIEDNITCGSVVTISLVAQRSIHDEEQPAPLPSLTNNEVVVIKALYPDATLGVTDVNHSTGLAMASIHTAFTKMEEAGLVEKIGKKRMLTEAGRQVVLSL